MAVAISERTLEPLERLCTRNVSRALIERPYSREPQAVGAVYDRPGFFVQSPSEHKAFKRGRASISDRFGGQNSPAACCRAMPTSATKIKTIPAETIVFILVPSISFA